MAPNFEAYRSMRGPAPSNIRRWQLHGPGLNSLREVTVALPSIQPNELLVRHDACGISLSDMEIINLGADHPRLLGRDLGSHPVVLGHECIVTVARVGADLADLYRVGQRCIVNPDVCFHGVGMSYGSALDGGLAEYGVITHEALEGDAGSYLTPVDDATGYVDTALVQPWACVLAAYEFGNYRSGILDAGLLLIVDVEGHGTDTLFLERHCHRASRVTNIDDLAGTDFTHLRRALTEDAGFDDIVVIGTPSGPDLGRIASALGARGILNLLTDRPVTELVPVDIGRIHHEQQLYVRANGPEDAADAYTANDRQDIKPGGIAWFIGAGGPMGQMHLRRALMLDSPPRKIVVTDTQDERLERLRERFSKAAIERNIELIALNPADGGDSARHGPYDDIVCMTPDAAVIAGSIRHLAVGGVYNVFAAVPKGKIAQLDLGHILEHNQRIIGTSGSSADTLRRTLKLVESGSLSPRDSLAAIGGFDAVREALIAVRDGRFPGKIVLFPGIAQLPLMSLAETQDKLPAVFARLKDGRYWTQEAEEELFRAFAPG